MMDDFYLLDSSFLLPEEQCWQCGTALTDEEIALVYDDDYRCFDCDDRARWLLDGSADAIWRR